jgi:hypothetical protein
MNRKLRQSARLELASVKLFEKPELAFDLPTAEPPRRINREGESVWEEGAELEAKGLAPFEGGGGMLL